MSAADAAANTSTNSDVDAGRERSSRLVLYGLVILVVGFTAALLANGLYPCVPAAGSAIEPPLTDCAVALSPWAGVALVGLVLALIGYRRVG
jgi:hypothetical protein